MLVDRIHLPFSWQILHWKYSCNCTSNCDESSEHGEIFLQLTVKKQEDPDDKHRGYNTHAQTTSTHTRTCLFKTAWETQGDIRTVDDGMICQSHLQQEGQGGHVCLGVGRQQDDRSDTMQSQRVISRDGHKPTNTHKHIMEPDLIDMN